MDLVSKSLEFR